ncbi:ntA domain-containing protein [Trichonephila inaurata madagascariensis]|uniref:NtA domain-containing protein n=1 Tax=Trichonephila inaurata madagascariensis TaxID=2747483 RepID=A0A8X6YI81_9ARAC|nr:ntA domain-containing protein [Trichonephila inaurata madagascariensis]
MSLTNGRPCQETKTLNEREEQADVVFTGTVEKIYRKSPERSFILDYNAVVFVKRVLKGDRKLQNNAVVVSGLGNRLICQSIVKERDTRIFLVTEMGNGFLQLNSSLLRISVPNLDLIDAVIKGKSISNPKHILSKKPTVFECHSTIFISNDFMLI